MHADYFGMISGRDADKFAASGLTPLKSELVDAPLVKEFPIAIECRLHNFLEIGLHTEFIGEILDVKADESCLGADGLPEIEKVMPILFSPEVRRYNIQKESTLHLVIRYRLGDCVWVDKDGNGQQDAGEPGLGGVDVNLGAGQITLSRPRPRTPTESASLIVLLQESTIWNLSRWQATALRTRMPVRMTKKTAMPIRRPIWYRILLQNRANVSLAAHIRDRQPAVLSLLNASAEPQVEGPDLVWVTGAIPVGESWLIEYHDAKDIHTINITINSCGMPMDIYYAIMLLVMWGLAFGIMTMPLPTDKISPAYSSWVDCASLIGEI